VLGMLRSVSVTEWLIRARNGFETNGGVLDFVSVKMVM
jgi:hypothetical protein